MNQVEPMPPVHLAAPKPAAIAGIVFSVLLITSLTLLLRTIPANLGDGGEWLITNRNTILLALNLVPFSGIAFLWFMGVVRDRIGAQEDQFLSTVFFGSGLLFLAMLFSFAAMTGSILLVYSALSDRLLAASYYTFGQAAAHEIMNSYAIKMAGVFMISTSTLFVKTRVIPRWMAFLGYGLAGLMLLRIGQLDRITWVSLLFPLWVLLISIYILIDNYRRKPVASPASL